MDKKLMLLLILCMVIIILSVFAVIYEIFPCPFAIETSLEEITSNFSAWVNRVVVVEGKLVGPMGFIPESTPPWNFELFGPNETIEKIREPDTVSIGVLWNSKGHYNFENARICGVVREGRWIYLWGERPTCYYLEAKTIDSCK